MSAGIAQAAAVDAFERALFVREAIDDVDRVCGHLDDATISLDAAAELIERGRVARLLGSLRRTGASEADLNRLREAFQTLAEQLTAAAGPVCAGRANAGALTEELQVELADVRSELRSQRS
jgi:hypothetical protein